MAEIELLKREGKPINNEEFYDLQYCSLLVTLSIVLTNEFGRAALAYFIEEERRMTLSALQTTKVVVITTFKFFNTAVVTWVASFFSLSNFSDQFRAGGLIDDISAVLVYYALIHQIWYMIDPISIIKAIMKNCCCMFRVTH